MPAVLHLDRCLAQITKNVLLGVGVWIVLMCSFVGMCFEVGAGVASPNDMCPIGGTGNQSRL